MGESGPCAHEHDGQLCIRCRLTPQHALHERNATAPGDQAQRLAQRSVGQHFGAIGVGKHREDRQLHTVRTWRHAPVAIGTAGMFRRRVIR